MGSGTRYRPALSSRLEYCQEWVRFCHLKNIDVKPRRRIARKNIDLYGEGLFKFRSRDVRIDPEAFNAAVSHVQRLLRSNVGMSRVLSFEEAVERVIAKTGMSAANARWNKYGQTKREVLTNPEALAKIREELHPDTLASVGLFTMSLKDELRDVVDGNPKDARVFMPVDLTLLIATIMCYGDFNDRFVDASFEGSLGGSFLHGNADTLVNRLRKHPFFGEGDAHKYDTTQNALLREAVYFIRDSLVPQSELRGTVRQCLCYPRFVLPNGQVWQVNGGNPSGSFNTLVDNSILTLIVLAYCLYRYYGFIPVELLEDIVTGDDYLYSTSDSEFTPTVVARHASELGLDFDAGELKSLADASFCQRRFVLDGGRWVAVPIDASKFLDTMLYNRCLDAFDLAVLSQSILIENYYIRENRTILREFQDFLRSEYLVDLEYLTDRQIDQLHKQKMVYECKLKVDPARFKKDYRETNSRTLLPRANYSRPPSSLAFSGFEDFIQSEALWYPGRAQTRVARQAALGSLLAAGGIAAGTATNRWLHSKDRPQVDDALPDKFKPMPMRKIPVQGARGPQPLVKGRSVAPAARAARQRVAQAKSKAPAGDMVYRAPAAMAIQQRSNRGMMSANSKKMVVTRREYLTDVKGFNTSGSIQVTSVPISVDSFPWAKNFALLYESYKIRRGAFEYVPVVSSTTPGFVILAPDYDPTDAHAASEGKVSFTNMMGAKSGNSWAPIICPLDPEALGKQKSLYTGGPAAATGAELRQNSAGNLWVAVGSSGTTDSIGELWVSYTIEFETPQIGKAKSATPDSISGSHARFAGSSNDAPFVLTHGNVPAQVSSTGTTTSVTTFTFSKAWSGYAYFQVSGVGVDTSIGGTGDESNIGTLEQSTTAESRFVWLDFDQGETLTFTITNTSVSSAFCYFMQGPDIHS